MAKDIFDTTKIGSMSLKNRIFRGAIGDMNSYEGFMAEKDFKTYEELARGGVGTILTGFATVSDYPMMPNYGMLRIDSDKFIPEHKKLVDMVHSHNTNIIMQIVHCGSNTFVNADKIYAPSAVENPSSFKMPVAMTKEDIERIKSDFVQAAIRVQKAGFDGVEIHSAHSYLLSEFLTPYYNRREDEYGGSDENRARFLSEIISATRASVGENYPILVKINSDDCIKDGITIDGFLTACEMAEKAGASGIEVSGNWLAVKSQTPYFLEAATKLADLVKIPVILVGGVRDIDTMNDILNNTNIEYFSLGRPLISEPDLINRWHSGDTKKTRCISCNKCMEDLNEMKCILK